LSLATVLVGVLLAFGLALAGVLPAGSGSRAAGPSGSGEVTAQSDDSVPATDVTMFGASPQEAAGETWGMGTLGGKTVLVRYTAEGGWVIGPKLLDSSGNTLSGFVLDQPTGLSHPSPLAAQMTPAGSGVLAGAVGSRQVLLVRSPGHEFQETAPLPETGEAALQTGESLFSPQDRAPLIVPLDESNSQAGALVVPVGGAETGVLNWNGKQWTREPIELPKGTEEGGFRVLAIAASSPTHAWLLAQLSAQTGAVALFRRRLGSEAGAVPRWQAVPPPGGHAGEALTVAGEPFTVKEKTQAQILTVTSEGVWIDGERTDVNISATVFFAPGKAEESSGEEEKTGEGKLESWCSAPSGSTTCDQTLPEELPSGPSRSFGWANSSSATPYGERVITGFPDGVSLRLEGSSFTRVLALGGSEAPRDPGGTFGAAFSEAKEGWLGEERLPVHLTLHPRENRLEPWPVPFRHALVAIAPQPGAPVGSLSSEALAVGDQGEVARYQPGKGWLPESLLGPGGRFERPRLRAVAWPIPTRAYAVGDEGEMWLWRGETGLWERDPATPYNFRGNLLGIAFDPEEPARGYAVGESGVLLGYGKTWTQEPLPAQVEGASFTSIAFAGSEAIVAYRKLLKTETRDYEGGLLVNEGSGWRVEQATAGLGVPWAVAGLPDGSAAFVAESNEGGSRIYERNGSGGSWEATPQPFPGDGTPGSLALFHEGEGGPLRVLATGKAPETFFKIEDLSPSPPGFPPPLVPPYPLESNVEKGVLRQTANGWSDEENELDATQEPPGDYREYDMVYNPDPVFALLVNETGTQGWAVGGLVDNEHPGGPLDTADVARYPAEKATPPGVGTSPIPVNAEEATFAIGGGAACKAPCATRANAKIGPDVWLTAAMARAGQVAGMRAFLYTGPRVAQANATEGPPPQFPYSEELERYAEVLRSSPIPVFAAPSPTDLDGEGGELTFEKVFAGFPKPFGGASNLSSLETAGSPCSEIGGSETACYAIRSQGAGGNVRVIVLDDSREVDSNQLEWLKAQLAEASGAGEPAIVVGNADLNTQIAESDGAARQVAQALISGDASAYFYDSPEENIKEPLQVGGESIPTFGSGTLGYVEFTKETSGEFLGASGFLLVQVSHVREADGRFHVSANLIPNIGELALEAKDGTLLRRSQVAQFDALARRPRAGNDAHNQSTSPLTSPYIPIPSNCVGTRCANNALLPEYTFSSSNPQVGEFVAPNLASAEQNAVLQGPNGKPIPDAESGLFCAYNPGTTVVTIDSGGLSSSLPVTVEAGSAEQPCGTVPVSELASPQVAVPVPPPAPAPAPAGPAPASTPPPVVLPPLPPPPVPAPPPARPPAPTPPAPFVPLAVATAPPLAFVPPPIPTPARPTPPTGTSAVTSPVEIAEREEEEESATESVSNQAVAYRSSEHEPSPAYILGLLVLAAFAGASARRRPRRGRREVRIAPATVSASRAQRRMSARRRRF
jgi:hypothetical protein